MFIRNIIVEYVVKNNTVDLRTTGIGKAWIYTTKTYGWLSGLKPKKRYCLLTTTQLKSKSALDKILEIVNSDKNANGELCNVILASQNIMKVLISNQLDTYICSNL